MTNTLAVRYYNGKQNRAHDAVLSVEEGHLCLQYDDSQTDYFALHQIDYIAGVGKVLPALELPHDARVEFLTPDIPDWLPLKHKHLLHHVMSFEKSWKWVGVGLVTVLFVMVAMFKWGIPVASYHLAHALPEKTLQEAGNQAERLLTKLTAPSELPPQRQQAITALYHKLQYKQPATIRFRKGGRLEANAFAIPNNTIVLTDELVQLAQNDEQILAVLAHEQGHLHHRHSLQQVFRGVGMSVFLLVITGDSGDLLQTLPTMLVSAQYSQNFELEADLYAVNELKRLNLSPKHMADMLTHLHQAHGHDNDDEESTLQIISTHPALQERVKQVENQMK